MSMPLAKAAAWLTPNRLRAHGLLLALSLWSVYIWNMSTPGLLDRAGNLKGTDFLHFYTLGSLALAHRGPHPYNDLYDMSAVRTRSATRSCRRRHSLSATLSSAGIDPLRALCSSLLSLGADVLADADFVDLWPLRLRPLARLPQPAQLQIHGSDSRTCLPCLLAPDRLGTNLRPGSRLLHPGLLRPARTA